MPRNVKSLTLDYSALSAWRRCPLYFKYRYADGLVLPQDAEALEFGKLMHLGLEQIYASPGIGALSADDISILLHEAEYLGAGNPPKDDAPSAARVLHQVAFAAGKTRIYSLVGSERRSLRHLLILLVRYMQNYLPDVLKPLMLEAIHKIEVPHTYGFALHYTGRIDMLEEDRVIETKTSSSLGNMFLARVNPNDQATGYCVLASDLLHKPITNVLFNGISTSGFGLKSAERDWPIHKDPSALFLRAETQRSEAAIEHWRERLINDAYRIVEDLERGTFSANMPDACTQYNTTCPFIQLCGASPSVRDTLIRNLYQTEPWPQCAIVWED